jgi:lipopolysaccharide/colanic/teichoic acid biosynthesis glycosyltransferase
MDSNRQLPVSPWTLSRRKRSFDFVVALLATALLLPLMAAVALMVRFVSGSPVFFKQIRCGRGGQPFHLLKFRSMRTGGVSGPGVTRAGDPRITPIGRIMRRWKLDELPQLLNVLRGDLSLVGPRPELPEYIAELGDTARVLRQLPPGVTGWATLHYRDEEELLAAVPAEQMREHYVRVLLPEKSALDLAYAARATMVSDIALLMQTCLAIMPGRSSARKREAMKASAAGSQGPSTI